ncbi:MAG: efflux RND transporter periplasmic adaptor subunit [Rhodocyclaceae bacterium]|nr:efflux RND transporter periplasmic adaptor subunit [Rhodocyclaceae bacterium]
MSRLSSFLCALLMAMPAFSQTVTLNAREVELTYPAEAVVEAVRQATVAAQVSGRLVEVRVDVGQRVAKGQVLMRLDTREAVESAAGVQAQLIQAKAAFERTRNLHAQKFISGAALDKAEADYKAAQAAAGVSGAALSHGTVTAPIAGIVAQRHAELGEMATPGRPLMTLHDPKGLRVVASIPQNKWVDVKRMLKAKLEFPETGQWSEATRVEVLPVADGRSHTMTARLYLSDDVKDVIPGMAVRAHFVIGSAKKLTVPPKAVIRRGEVIAVYVMDAQNTPRLRQVRLGEMQGNGEWEVLAGLSVGNQVSLEPIQSGITLKNPK